MNEAGGLGSEGRSRSSLLGSPMAAPAVQSAGLGERRRGERNAAAGERRRARCCGSAG
jgi:hypothetical protein